MIWPEGCHVQGCHSIGYHDWDADETYCYMHGWRPEYREWNEMWAIYWLLTATGFDPRVLLRSWDA